MSISEYNPDDPLAMWANAEEDVELKSSTPPQTQQPINVRALSIPDRRPSQEIETARNIAMVTDGIIAVSLERNFLDNDAAKRLMAVLNYATPDMMNPAVQEILIRAKPHLDLRSAFKDKMVQGFAVGINRTALLMCKGLAMASVARVLLNACLKKMGLEAEGRQYLLNLTVNISRQMDNALERTQKFAEVMAVTMERMGTTAFLIENGADINMLIKGLQESQSHVLQTAMAITEENKASEISIAEGCNYIQSIIQDDTRLEERKRYVDEAKIAWEEQQDVLHRLNETYYAEEGAVSFDIANHKGRLAMYERRLRAREEDFQSQTRRLHHINESIGRFEQMKQTVRSDRSSSSRLNGAEINKAALNTAQEEVAAQQKAYDDQIQRLQARARKLGYDVSEYRAKSLTASDGTEMLVMRERTGRFFWAKKTYKQERRTTRPNEKQRLVELAEHAARERRDVEKEVERLIQERSQVKSRIRERMRQEHLRIATNADEYSRQRNGEQLRNIDQQIRYFEELRLTVEAARRKTQDEIENLGQTIARERQMLVSFENKLQVLHGQDYAPLKRKKAAETRTEELRQNYERKRKEYERLVQAFGIESNQDFATFMKVFQMLNTATQNLPQAMKMLSNAFAGAYRTFNSEFFKKDFQALPEDRQAVALLKVTTNLRAICEVGWEYFEAPLLNLLEVDANIVLGRLVQLEEQQQAALESNNATVEEVIEA